MSCSNKLLLICTAPANDVPACIDALQTSGPTPLTSLIHGVRRESHHLLLKQVAAAATHVAAATAIHAAATASRLAAAWRYDPLQHCLFGAVGMKHDCAICSWLWSHQVEHWWGGTFDQSLYSFRDLQDMSTMQARNVCQRLSPCRRKVLVTMQARHARQCLSTCRHDMLASACHHAGTTCSPVLVTMQARHARQCLSPCRHDMLASACQHAGTTCSPVLVTMQARHARQCLSPCRHDMLASACQHAGTRCLSVLVNGEDLISVVETS